MFYRQQKLQQWLQQLNLETTQFSFLTGDASFRNYYRLQHHNQNYIVMDAPPAQENLLDFINIGNLLKKLNIRTPNIYYYNLNDGFAIIEDFGNTILYNHNHYPNFIKNYITSLLTLNTLHHNAQHNQTLLTATALTEFNIQFMLLELDLCKTWFIEKYLNITLTQAENTIFNDAMQWLAQQIQQQPQTLIHRDYHSRNIMLLNQNELGIIDFQDAMIGPITYDLVSLLKDCYFKLTKKHQDLLLKKFYQNSVIGQQLHYTDFIKAFHLSGLQRHFKILGIFSRLYLRDNKKNYLQYLPLTLQYVINALQEYTELQQLYIFFQTRIQIP